MEMRGHEHVVEVAIFAPLGAYGAIRELAGVKVRNIASIVLIFTWNEKSYSKPALD